MDISAYGGDMSDFSFGEAAQQHFKTFAEELAIPRVLVKGTTHLIMIHDRNQSDYKERLMKILSSYVQHRILRLHLDVQHRS